MPHRIRLCRALVCLVALSSFRAATLQAQDIEKIVEILKREPIDRSSKTKDETPVVTDLGVPIFFLRDQSKVAGTPHFESLGVKTKYGTLQIPFKNLTRVRFARRVDPTVKKIAEELVHQLGSDDFDEREDAMEGLRELGERAIGFLQRAKKSADEETRNRAEILVEEIEENLAEQENGGERGARGDRDEVKTDHMTVKGIVLAESFAVKTKYGTLEINVADLATVHFKPTGATARRVEVTPGFQPPGKWLDTKLDVEKRQDISIQASGTTQAANWNVTSGPDGSRRYSGNTFNKFPTLTLIGKIGKNGKPFKVGSKYKARAGAKGRLYLSIVAFMYSPASTTGKYTAKIKLGTFR